MAATIFSLLPTSDSADLTTSPSRIICSVAGNAVIVNSANVAVTFTGLVAGQFLELSPRRINATGTTASIVGVFSQ